MQPITITEKIYNRIETQLLELVPQERVGPIFKWLFKIPVLEYKLGLGWVIGRFILLLTTKGRKSGKERFTALEYLFDEKSNRYRIFAGWGGRTDWYLNLCADPNVMVQVGRRKFPALAEPASEAEVADYMQWVSGRHPGMDRIWSRWSDQPVGGSWESYRHAARFFPSVWLKPVKNI
jgi:deazaflavin-dependent oxidoreductase (nitroreductase family)